MKWPKEILEEYEEFNKSRECTRAHKLIEVFFETKEPPCFFAGNITKAKFGLLELNPDMARGDKRNTMLSRRPIQ